MPIYEVHSIHLIVQEPMSIYGTYKVPSWEWFLFVGMDAPGSIIYLIPTTEEISTCVWIFGRHEDDEVILIRYRHYEYSCSTPKVDWTYHQFVRCVHIYFEFIWFDLNLLQEQCSIYRGKNRKDTGNDWCGDQLSRNLTRSWSFQHQNIPQDDVMDKKRKKE